MTRQNLWGKVELARLKLVLGARCNICGNEDELEFDCIAPQGHEHHSNGRSFRACFYRRQMRAGNLQLLCRTCHEKKTARENAGEPTTVQDLKDLPY